MSEDSKMQKELLENMTEEQIEQLRLMLEATKPKELVFPDIGERGKILSTLDNFRALFDFYDITLKYNEMTKELEIDIPGREIHPDLEMNAKLGYLIDYCNRNNLPTTELQTYVTLLGEQRAYHPVRDWIDQQQWDGQDRLQEWYATVVLDGENALKETMMYKWALSAVAALYHHNFSCEGVLTWQSPQGVGKTIQIENIIPRQYHNQWNKDAVVIDMSNKDTLLKALSYWIVELGEIDATFRKSDIEALKGFITEKVDVLRPPYERKPNKYSRRTVFYASVNQKEFLQDNENRRFWVLSVKKFLHADIDTGQFWAQIKHHYLQIRDKISTAAEREHHQEWGWFMSPAERLILSEMQQEFKAVDSVDQILYNYIRSSSETQLNNSGEWMNVTAILSKIGKTSLQRRDLATAGRWLRDNGFEPDSRRQYFVDIDDTGRAQVDQKTIEQLTRKIKELKRGNDL